jgi:hypothetical protein
LLPLTFTCHLSSRSLEEEGAISWLNKWTKERNLNKNKTNTTDLTDCQLDAMWNLGSSETTCGVLCNITDYAGIVPEPCKFSKIASLDKLWVNNDCKLRCLVNIYLVLDQATLTISDSLLSSQQWKGKLTQTAKRVRFLLQSPCRRRLIPLL